MGQQQEGEHEVHEQHERQERQGRRWPRGWCSCARLMGVWQWSSYASLRAHACRQLQISSSHEAVRDSAPSHSSPSDAPDALNARRRRRPLRLLLFCLRHGLGAVGTASSPSLLSDLRRRRGILRLLQWNVLDGCNMSPQRLGGIGRWLRQRGVDVVGLNEMNGWSDRTFGQLARSWGSATPH